jgi:hypothetical protein
MILMAALTLGQVLLDPAEFMQTFLFIRDKRDRIVPLHLNPIQRKTLEIRRRTIRAGKPRRWIVLKARKQGQTTLWQALNFHTVATKPNTRCVTLGHETDATEQIFQMADFFWQRMPKEMRPARLTEHDKRDLEFPGLNSMFYIGTAGKKGFGRGTTISRYLATEAAWYLGGRKDHEQLFAGLDEAAQEGEGTMESTPNGVGNYFHETYQLAKEGANDFTPIFFRWFDDPTYRKPLPCPVPDFLATYSDEEKALVAKHGLDPEQIAWRRAMKRKRGRLAPQEYPEDDVACFLLSGHCFYDRTILEALRLRAPAPIENLWPDQDGVPQLRIWKHPEPGHRYAAGGDTSEGVAGGNKSALVIRDIVTLEPVAVLQASLKPEDLGKRSAQLAEKYNRALLAIERNNHGHSTLNTLENVVGYKNLYWHQEYDVKSGTSNQVLGWATTPKSRPIMLDRHREAVEAGEAPLWDERVIGECMTFVKQEGARVSYAAEDGCQDDLVIADSICLQVREAALGSQATVPSSADPMATVPSSGLIYPSGDSGRLY